MKTSITNFSKNARKAVMFIALLGTAASFTACTDHDDLPQPEPAAALSIFNASTITPSMDFSIDNQRVNSSPIAYGTRIDYVRVTPGTRKLTATSTNSSTSTVSLNAPLESNKFQSAYVVPQNDTLSIVMINDDYSVNPASGNAGVRFVNMATDPNAYSMEVAGDTTTFNNVAFKGATGFKNVKSGTYTINVKNSTTNATVYTLPDVEFGTGKFYTLWAKGTATSAIPELKVTIKSAEARFAQ